MANVTENHRNREFGRTEIFLQNYKAMKPGIHEKIAGNLAVNVRMVLWWLMWGAWNGVLETWSAPYVHCKPCVAQHTRRRCMAPPGFWKSQFYPWIICLLSPSSIYLCQDVIWLMKVKNVGCKNKARASLIMQSTQWASGSLGAMVTFLLIMTRCEIDQDYVGTHLQCFLTQEGLILVLGRKRRRQKA